MPCCTKVHGLLRVGTNYTSAVLGKNFPTLVLESEEGAWKHGPLSFRPGFRYVIVVKNPYSWFLSFQHWEQIHHRAPNDQPRLEFLSNPVTHPRFAATWQVSNPVDAWVKPLQSWLQYVNDENVRFVRYEDLIGDFPATMRSLASLYGIEESAREFVNIETRVDAWKTPRPRKELDLDFYRRRSFAADFTEEALTFIRTHIDQHLMQRFDYALL